MAMMRCFSENVEHLMGPWPLLVVEGGVQTDTVIAMGNLPDRLGSKGNCLRDVRRRNPICELPWHKRAEDHTHLLDTTSQQFHNLS